jgi:hypothetical protein
MTAGVISMKRPILYKVLRQVAVAKAAAVGITTERRQLPDILGDAGRLLATVTRDAERYARDEGKYGPWQVALPLACEYMFSLNRAAKPRGPRIGELGIT